MAFKVSAGESYSSAFQSSRGVGQSTFFLCKKGNLGRTRRNSGDKTFFVKLRPSVDFRLSLSQKNLKKNAGRRRTRSAEKNCHFYNFSIDLAVEQRSSSSSTFCTYLQARIEQKNHEKRIRQLEQKLKGCLFQKREKRENCTVRLNPLSEFMITISRISRGAGKVQKPILHSGLKTLKRSREKEMRKI